MPSNTPYVITGIQAGLDPNKPNEPKPLRQDVDVWYSDPSNSKQHTLFFRALAAFQELPVHDKLSYWQVAGIHGEPFVPWDENTKSKTHGIGYCTHGSVLFPDWHRPYMLLFEQRLYEIMLELVKEYPPAHQPEYLAAAKSWRFPYWDWAAKKQVKNVPTKCDYTVPQIVLPKTVRVEVSRGSWTAVETIPNPMYAFHSPDDIPMGSPVYGDNGLQSDGGIYYNLCTSTSRCPSLYDPQNHEVVDQWVYGVQNNSTVEKNLRQHGWSETGDAPQSTDSLGEAVYRMYSKDHFSTYDAFASTRLVDDFNPGDYLSIEGVHNNIHNWTGGAYGGHMMDTLVAAFDPIFWLHHCNVDRQFAIWQTLNPETWFDDKSQQVTDELGNWSTPPNSISTPETGLAPFHIDSEANYYTPDTVREWFKLGYSYPELQPWNFLVGGGVNQKAYIADIRKRVTKLYSSTRHLVFNAKKPIAQHPDVEKEAPKHAVHSDYVVNVRFERFALGGAPFTVHILIGDKYNVGSVYNFVSRPRTLGPNTGCENCRQQQESQALQKGQVIITNALIQAVHDESEELGSLEIDDVEKYLQDKLRWVVKKSHREVVPLESIPSLKVSVAGGTGLHHYDDHHGSRYSGYEVLRNITHGRPGGLGHNDTY